MRLHSFSLNYLLVKQFLLFVFANIVLNVSVKLKQKKKTVRVIRMWFSMLDEATNFAALCEAGASVFFGNTSLD